MAIIRPPEPPKKKKEQSKNRPEAEIFRVAALKLKAEGWKVVAELPFPMSSAFVDGGCRRAGEYMLIEAKCSFSARLQQQLRMAQMGAPYVLGVIKTKPRPDNEMMGWAKKEGIGIWRVDGEDVQELLRPMFNTKFNYANYTERFSKYIDEWEENLDGGRPTEKGIGHAITCAKLVDEYRKQHPKAKWREIFEKVPNHYSTHTSMGQALRFLVSR